VAIDDGRDRTVTIVNDLNGQAIRRDEADLTSAGDPHEIWYRFGGRQLGYTGNNGTLETDYQTTAESRAVTQGTGAFRNGATLGASYGDFALGYAPVTSFSDAGGGAHIVQAGETLSSIAANLWGDASLWYKLAEANGMTAATALSEGQQLRLPAGVMRSSHNAATFKPFDPSETIGDTSPTTPKPQKNNKCGMMGQVMIAVVAVAVTFATSGALTGLLGTVAGGFASGAAASIVSQGVGIAVGAQEKFSWKGVALAAVSGGVSGGLDKLATVGGFGALGGGTLASDVLRATVANVASQGIAVATGLSDKFNWAGVAAAGVVGGITGMVRRGLPGAVRPGHPASVGNVGMGTTAGAIAGAAARSLLTGTSFGDNVLAVLPDVIASTVGYAGVLGAASLRSPPRVVLANDRYWVQPESEYGESYHGSVDPDIIVTALRGAAGAVDWFGGIVDRYLLQPLERNLRQIYEWTPHMITIRLTARAADSIGVPLVGRHINGVGNLQSGYVVGLGEQGISTIRGAASIVRHPVATAQGVGRGLVNGMEAAITADPIDVVNGLSRAVQPLVTAVRTGDTFEIGRIAGRTTGAAADFAVGSHGLGNLSRVSRVGRAADAMPGPTANPVRGARADPPTPATHGPQTGVRANQAAGAAWEQHVIENVLPQTQIDVRPQITIRSAGPSGLRVRLDALGRDVAEGQTRLSDMKGSPTAGFTPNQTVVYPELSIYGGVIVGRGKAPYTGGTIIPPTEVDIIRKRN
jgi:hypothetical protein